VVKTRQEKGELIQRVNDREMRSITKMWMVLGMTNIEGRVENGGIQLTAVRGHRAYRSPRES
jgi:hypothetical protein